MKKSVVVLIFIAFTLSSCSFTTLCPTYAKKEVKEVKKFEKQTRI